MNDVMEKCKTSRELRDDLLALKLRIAFQEELEEEIEEISEEPFFDPELSAAIHRTDARIIKLIRRNVRKNRITQTAKATLPRLGRALAVCLLVFYIALTTAVAAVPFVRKSVLHFIMEIDEKYTSLEFVNSGIEIEVPIGWRGKYYLSYIPDGYIFETTDGFEVSYRNAQGKTLLFAEYGSETSVNIDTEDASLGFVDIQGQNALLSEKNGWVTLAWAVADHYFILDFQGNKEEAVRIAESIVHID